jgi:hypothetical protein
VHILPFQNVSGTQPVFEQKPKEDFVLGLAECLPKPIESLRNLAMAHQESVSF